MTDATKAIPESQTADDAACAIPAPLPDGDPLGMPGLAAGADAEVRPGVLIADGGDLPDGDPHVAAGAGDSPHGDPPCSADAGDPPEGDPPVAAGPGELPDGTPPVAAGPGELPEEGLAASDTWIGIATYPGRIDELDFVRASTEELLLLAGLGVPGQAGFGEAAPLQPREDEPPRQPGDAGAAAQPAGQELPGDEPADLAAPRSREPSPAPESERRPPTGRFTTSDFLAAPPREPSPVPESERRAPTGRFTTSDFLAAPPREPSPVPESERRPPTGRFMATDLLAPPPREPSPAPESERRPPTGRFMATDLLAPPRPEPSPLPESERRTPTSRPLAIDVVVAQSRSGTSPPPRLGSPFPKSYHPPGSPSPRSSTPGHPSRPTPAPETPFAERRKPARSAAPAASGGARAPAAPAEGAGSRPRIAAASLYNPESSPTPLPTGSAVEGQPTGPAPSSPKGPPGPQLRSSTPLPMARRRSSPLPVPPPPPPVGDRSTILADPQKRQEYNLYMELRRKATQAGQHDEAARLFRDGERLLGGHRYAEALQRFDRACQLNEGELLYRACRAWAEFMHLRSRGPVASTVRDKLLEQLRKALELEDGKDRVYYYMGLIFKDAGSRKEAITHFQGAVAVNPYHIEAKRELRLFAMQREKEEEDERKKTTGRHGPRKP